MQKIILSAQVATRILSGKHLMLCAILMVLASGLSAQEQDALSFIDSLTNIIIQQKAQSDAQKETVASLRKQLLFELKNNKTLNKADRTRLWVTMGNLESKQGVYAALIPKNEVSEEILAYEKKLQELADSIAHIQQQLIAAIEEPSNTTRTKEKAVHVLASIHKEEVIQYLLKNEKSLRFGAMDPEDYDIQAEEAIRTAMVAIFHEYFSKPEVNWLVFPFILKYVDTDSFLEIGMVRELSGYGKNEHSRDSWYLLKFMQANASPAFKTVIEGELRVVKKPEEKR